MHTLALWGVDQQLWPYRGASRKRLLNYHSENDRKKEFMMFCHCCITLKQRFMVMDIGRRAKHTYKWCEGGHHPLHCPPPHSGSVVRATSEGPSVKGLQQQHSRCGHRFLWGAKWTIIPSNPSAAFPETEEFSLNPEEKYLYMRFYDLKSVLETDLCPLFPEKSWVGRCFLPNTALHGWILYCTCKKMNEALQSVLKSDTTRE